MNKFDITLTESHAGSYLCTQACYVMLCRALLDEDITIEQAQKETGYRKGHETWPYEMLLAAANRGIAVHSIEVFDPEVMAEDPASEVQRIFADSNIASAVIDDMDLDRIKKYSTLCLDNNLIDFSVRTPVLADISKAIDSKQLPMVTLDYGVLAGTGKYEGHMVLVSDIGKDGAEVWDPGPPSRAGEKVDLLKLDNAIHSPMPFAGQVILASKT